MIAVEQRLEELIGAVLDSHPGVDPNGIESIVSHLAEVLVTADDLVVVARPSIDDSDTAVIAAALREHNAPLIGGPDGYPGDEFDCCAEQVAAALRVAHGTGGDHA